MKHSTKTVALFAAAITLAGCSHMTPRYGISATNIENIHQAAGASPRKVSVGTFTATKPGLSSITCRAAGGVTTPDHESFATYIQNALTSELKVANVYDAASSVRIDGKLEDIDFNSNIGAGKWVIDLTVSAPGVAPVTIQEVHPFSTNWVADRACEQVGAALQPAVQETLGKLFASSSFKAMVTNP